MQKIVTLILCGLTLTGLGCSDKPAAVRIEKPKNRLPVIVHLETRNEVVTIMSGRDGPLYTVTTKAGWILARNLSAEELQAKLPNTYHLLKTSYADGEDASPIWAGSDP